MYKYKPSYGCYNIQYVLQKLFRDDSDETQTDVKNYQTATIRNPHDA